MTATENEATTEESNETLVSRRSLFRGGLGLGAGVALGGVLAACSSGDGSAGGSNGDDPIDVDNVDAEDPLRGSNETNMQGKTVEMGFAVLAGWPPSQAAVELYPEFAKYAKEKFGYTTTVKKTEAGFDKLFQQLAPGLSSGSQENNIMISDSQWLGAFAERDWIVRAEDVYAINPDLDLDPYSSLVRKTYQEYPDGSGTRWGFPQMPDTQGLFMRLDMLEDEANQTAFEEQYGKKLPTTYEEFEPMTMVEYEEIFEFFNRPEEGMHGTAMMYGKDYDSFSCAYHPYAYTTGDIWNPETGEVIGFLNTDDHATALEYFVSLQKYQPPGSEANGIGTMIDLFTEEKVFSAMQWLAVGLAMDGDGKLEGKILAVPHPKFEFPDGSIDVIGAMGGQPWVINKFNDDDHMRVAIDFLRWWYSDDAQAKFEDAGGLPWTADKVNAEGFEDSKYYARAFKEMLGEDKSRDFWHLPQYAELLAIQQEAYNKYAADPDAFDPKRVLDFIAVKQQEILLDNGVTDVAIPDELKDITLE